MKVTEPGKLPADLCVRGGTPRFVWPLPPDRTAGPFARRLVEQACIRLAVPRVDAGNAVAMVSELAANSVMHAPGPREIRLHCPACVSGRVWLVCAVVNSGTKSFALPAGPGPELTLTDIDAAEGAYELEHGRGLITVSALSGGRCGVRPTTMVSPSGPVAGVAAWFAIPGHRTVT